MKTNKNLPPTLRIPLFVFKVELDLLCTGKELAKISKNVYRIISDCESYDDADEIPGKIKASFSASGTELVKMWTLTIITPPLPENHPIMYRLEGATICMFYSKHFVSRSSTLDVYATKEIK